MKIEKVLPSPLALAILLTLLSMVMALWWTPASGEEAHFFEIVKYWQNGIWNEALLVFAYQMMLILVLGHILALSKPMQRLLDGLTKHINSTTKAVVVVSFFTLLVAFFNWGLCLVFGAILVRKIGEKAAREGFALNYPLLGAAGYVGMMAWHGGISGSAPLKAAEPNHLLSLFSETKRLQVGDKLPEIISTSMTIFSSENLWVFALLLVFVPTVLWWQGKKKHMDSSSFYVRFTTQEKPSTEVVSYVESSSWVGWLLGLLLLFTFGYANYSSLLQFQITPNQLNLFMLGLGFALHGNLQAYQKALNEAIQGASGILIQFPLYFGIMGIMKESGLVTEIANACIQLADVQSLPILTFISAGFINFFVPSGGGQWAIQGPIALEAGLELGVPLPKMIMALAYGDQVTNMLQPFWALPLLAITRLKASEILPYTLLLFGIGSLVFLVGLWFIY